MLVYDKEEPVTDNLITWVFDENSFVPAAKLVGDKSYSILTDHLGTPYEGMMKRGKRCGHESWIFTETLLLVIARLFLSYIKDNTTMRRLG